MIREQLLEKLSEQNYVSGETLAHDFGVSRTAVWKQINQLRKNGYEIESVQNKGYRLISRPDTPLAEEVTLGLNTGVIGNQIKYYDEVSSTNQIARELAGKQADDGTVVVADVQTQGRGRKNRSWHSPQGGLWFSIILYPNLPPQRAMLVTMTASIAVVEGIHELTGLQPAIKWPNDILLNGKKICGVLTELDSEMDRINYIIVGIGINVNNQLNAALKKHATTLASSMDHDLSRVELLQAILRSFDTNYQQLTQGDHRFIRERWFELSDILERTIRVKGEKQTVSGVVTGVDNDGSLLLKTKSGVLRIVSGDVEYM